MKFKYLAYTFLIILFIIPFIDKDDKYFIAQIVCLLLVILFSFLEWNKTNKKNGVLIHTVFFYLI